MLHFENDYNKGAHPRILEALVTANDVAQTGYGLDAYSQSAADKLRDLCACPEAEVSFLSGGTQTNQIVISAMLAPYQGVLAADTGHISTHEAGAIESTGHKVLNLPHHQGKLIASQVQSYLEDFYNDSNHEHMVFPGMVYISHPTEYGTLYSYEELKALSQVCKQYKIPLFLDGARLAYGLAAQPDLDLADIAALTDVFYLGGTKIGTFLGEAVVFTKGNQPPHFATYIKQRGALLAKGWLLGLQFDTLLTDALFLDIGRHAVSMAEQMTALLKERGYRFYLESLTNQQFIIVNNQQLEILAEELAYSFWERYDDQHTVIRLATSWSTSREDIDRLRELLDRVAD